MWHILCTYIPISSCQTIYICSLYVQFLGLFVCDTYKVIECEVDVTVGYGSVYMYSNVFDPYVEYNRNSI